MEPDQQSRKEALRPAFDQLKYWVDNGDLIRTTKTGITIGNVAPGPIRPALEVPIPGSDDQRYGFSIWARNGLVSEQLLMHRTPSGLVGAWRVERMSPQVKNGKQWTQKLDEYIMQGFPPEKLTWN